MKETPYILTAPVAGTDKMRIRFCIQNFTQKMQAVIFDFFKRKWQRDVVVVRWPRPNVVEIRLSNQMIRSAGVLEVTQEVKRYWNNFIRLLEQHQQRTQATPKRIAQ